MFNPFFVSIFFPFSPHIKKELSKIEKKLYKTKYIIFGYLSPWKTVCAKNDDGVVVV